jgi:hypothetical protein
MVESSLRTQGARRCAGPDCEYCGRCVVRGMRLPKKGNFSVWEGCHAVYEAREVIDPSNEDYRI